jgi:hypothetical protein
MMEPTQMRPIERAGLSSDRPVDRNYFLCKIHYSRGGQLFWLGGHFVEAEVGGGPHLLK